MARLLPVLPLFGRGDVKLQPVYVGDVAEAATKALATPGAQGKTYELGGPRVFTYEALLRLALAETGRKRMLIPVPYVVWDILALLMAALPRAPISRDQVTLMKRDNVVAADALTLADLGITSTPCLVIAGDLANSAFARQEAPGFAPFCEVYAARTYGSYGCGGPFNSIELPSGSSMYIDGPLPSAP